MIWEQDQRNGFFGWAVSEKEGVAAQPLHKGTVDVHEAVVESRDLMQLWSTTQQHPDSPPFTGGVLDAWPAFAVDALAICRLETQRIRSHIDAGRKR